MKNSIKLLSAVLASSLILGACDRLPNYGVDTGDGTHGGQPTAMPTGTPTGTPTAVPTGTPTGTPTATPTTNPTAMPTGTPMPTATPSDGDFVQVERLARPAINEGLIRQEKNDLLNTWNMVPPTADLSDAAKPLAEEATTVLKALGNSDAQVEALFKALLPDVMRIDTTHKSGYAGSAPGMLDNLTKDLRPIGGRLIKDDVMDVTLAVIVPGGAPAAAAIAGLESDNVSYDGPNANGTKHKPVMSEFPYLAAPN